MPSVSSVHSNMAQQQQQGNGSSTMTLEPGQEVPAPALNITRTRNRAGFSSASRSNSCPARDDPSYVPVHPTPLPKQSAHPKSRNRSPQPLPQNPNPNPIPGHPASGNLGGNPLQAPEAYFIGGVGEEGTGEIWEEEGEGDANLYAETRPDLVGKGTGSRAGKGSREGNDDPWSSVVAEQHRERERVERDSRAVNTAGAWSGYTGTTHSVGNAVPAMQQAPILPSIRPQQFVSSNFIPFSRPSQSGNPSSQHQQHAYAPPCSAQAHTAYAPPYTAQAHAPYTANAYTGTHWQQDHNSWMPSSNPFASTFQENPFSHASPFVFNSAEGQQHSQTYGNSAVDPMTHFTPGPAAHPHAANVQQQCQPCQPTNPLLIQSCQHCQSLQTRLNEFGHSPEFQPPQEYQPQVPRVVLPFKNALQAAGNVCANLLGMRSQGTNADRACSSDFRPPEMTAPSASIHASMHEFMQGWNPGPQQLFSSIGNPLPPNPSVPMPYSTAPPAIPQAGHHSSHAVIPHQVSFEDFMPTMAEQWESQQQAGQSNSFFGLQSGGWKQECRAMGAAPTAFNYAHIPVAAQNFGEERGMFGDGWGEDVGDNEDPGDIAFNSSVFMPPEVFHSPVNSGVVRPTFLPQSPYSFGMPGRPPPSPWVAQGVMPPSAFGIPPPGFPGGPPGPPNPFNHGHLPPQKPPSDSGSDHGGMPHRGPGNFLRNQQFMQQTAFAGQPPAPPPFPGGPPGFPGGPPGPPLRPVPPYYPGQCRPQFPNQGPPQFPGACQQIPPPGPPRNQKRWLPPPAFTPNSTTGPSYKAWLWTLAAWSRLTATPWEDRALVVGLSLGGRARTLVQSIPHAVLHCRTGLATLLQRMEEDFGAELQDRVKASSVSFDSFRRGKNMGAAEYLAAFEASYQNSVDHGLFMSPPLLAIRLIERANLSPSQEDWVMQAVGGDYTNYQGLRRALRRLPSLNRDAVNSFPVNLDGSQAWPVIHENAGNYSPFSAAEPVPPPPPEEDDEAESCSDWSDDYCSTGSGDEGEGMLVQQAWAQLRVFRKRKAGKSKGSKGKGKRRRKKGKGKGAVFVISGEEAFPIHQRNSSNDVPQGWTSEKWLAREPCPGCGSRYHRDCTKHTKGHSSAKGGKGGGGKSKGQGFAVFMMTAAAMLGQTLGFDTNQTQPMMSCGVCTDQPLFSSGISSCPAPFQPEIPDWRFVFSGDVCPLFSCEVSRSSREVAPAHPLIGTDLLTTYAETVPCSPTYNCPVFPVSYLPSFSNQCKEQYEEYLSTADPHQTFVGLEPFGPVFRDMRYSAFAEDVRLRYALMLDTGAPQTCCGITWMTRYLEDMGITNETWSPFSASLSGIGAGSATVRWKVTCPVGVENYVPTMLTAQILEGIGKGVPCLFGLQPMTALNAVIDLRDKTITLDTPKGDRKKLVCHVAAGHMLLPIDWGGKAFPESREKFISDPLGLAVWFSDESENSANTQPADLPTFSFLPSYIREEVLHDETVLPLPCFPCLQHLPSAQTCFPLAPDLPPGLNATSVPATGEKSSSSNKFEQFEPLQMVTATVEPPTDFTYMHPAFVALVNRTHGFMSKFARREFLMQNSTYKKKYQPMPKDTPLPRCNITPGIWDVWELWAGCARLTSACLALGLKCGPPITKELGWDLSLKHHQNEIWSLYLAHRPHILWAAPTCGPWSQSNTNMQGDIKEAIREEQLEAFNFYMTLVAEQHRRKEDQVTEQPRSSELLHQKGPEQMKSKFGAEDYITCMCPHGLTDPDSQKPYMKQTTLRSTLPLKRCIKWCSCKVSHEQMQGYTRSGKLRTASAQSYTKLFCSRVAQDFLEHIKSKALHKTAFPINDGEPEYLPNPSYRPRDREIAEQSDEEVANPKAVEDPYQEEEVEELTRKADRLENSMRRTRESRPDPSVPQYSVPTAKRVIRPTKPVVIDVDEPVEEVAPEQPNPSDEKAPSAIGEVEDQLVDPNAQPLQLAVKKPVVDTPALNDIAKVGIQLANGAQRTFQTGQKFKLMQELFATPSMKNLRLVILTKKPGMIPSPEPLVSRALLTHFLHLTQDTADSTWQNHGWREISELTQISRSLPRKPAWSFVLFATHAEEGDLAQHMESSLLETLEERAELAKANNSSLPVVLRVLTEGDQQAVLRMLLSLHKRLYHRKGPELRAILNRSGIPGKVLSLVDDAISMCAECRRWASTHAAPSVKTRIAGTFNSLVYADLIFVSDPQLIFLVIVDDCLRWVIVHHVNFKDFATLTEAFRRSWLSLFGPMETLRTDSESALAHDSFGIFLESLGIKRELVLAKDAHTMLGPLDRKIKILRLAAPRIIDTLLQDSIRLSPDDLASELQYSANTQLTYGGVSAYNCLFGTHPKEFWSDETDTTSSYDIKLPFHEMIHVRQRAVAAFHQALLRYRLEKGVKSRPRTDNAQQYVVGQLVDIYLKSGRKDLEGWRGPGTILGFCGEGRATIRWQSVVRDMPYHLIRPYLHVINPGSAPLSLANVKLPNVPAIANASDVPDQDEITPGGSSSSAGPKRQSKPQPLTGLVFVVPPGNHASEDVADETCFTFSSLRSNYEAYFNSDAADQLRSPYLSTLMSLASAMQIGQQQIHAFEVSNSSHPWSKDSIRDEKVVFGVAKKLAEASGVRNFAGVILQAGRRYMPPWNGIHKFHCIAWTHPEYMRVITLPGQSQIDWIVQGTSTLEELHLLRTVICLEARKECPALQLMLDAAPVENDVIQVEGRVREQWIDQGEFETPDAYPDDENLTDPGPSISERDQHEVFCASCESTNLIRRDTHADRSIHDAMYFPLNKDSRPLTDHEIKSMAPEVRESKLKELMSWVKNKAGKATLKTEYTKRTGLKPLPTRWVGTFKRKKGVKIVKQRLVGKGFAEQNQASLETSSPTATRTGHRIVMSISARKRWQIHSLDVSAAFLKGFDFEKLRELGHARQPVALNVSAEIFQLLAELDKDAWQVAAADPDNYCIELSCGAYGLKDGPLLWFIRFISALTEHGMKQSCHDPCVFYLPLSPAEIQTQSSQIASSGVAISLIMSLHVDDTLATGEDAKLEWLNKFLISEFEDVTCECNHFRHFGVDVYRHPTCFHISACQKDYIAELQPIKLPTRSKKETKCDAELITAYRSLCSGIAWVGVTYAPALAAASLYQSFLPVPSHENCHQMNSLLQQLRIEYEPLMFRSDLQGPFRIVEIGDSSLGNASKYSQGGFYVVLASRNENMVCGNCHQLAFKSSKSKRVASSTEHAETLALMSGMEESLFLQTWMYEVSHPHVTSMQLLNVPGRDHVPIVGVMDCLDVLESLVKTAVPTPVNRALTLYLHALRELNKLGFVEAYCWCDTRDNVANCLTKLKPDGCLDLAGLKDFYRGGGWEPTHPFRWHSARLTDPQIYVVVHLPVPPPSTKSFEDSKLTESNQKELASMLPSLQYRFAYISFEIELPV